MYNSSTAVGSVGDGGTEGVGRRAGGRGKKKAAQSTGAGGDADGIEPAVSLTDEPLSLKEVSWGHGYFM